MLVQDLALGEGTARAALLPQPVELFLREAGEDDLVIEVRERFEPDDTYFLHRPKVLPASIWLGRDGARAVLVAFSQAVSRGISAITSPTSRIGIRRNGWRTPWASVP